MEPHLHMNTWYVPPSRRAAWDALPKRALGFGSGADRATIEFPEPSRAELELLAHDLALAAPPAGRDVIQRVARRFLDRAGAERKQALEQLASVTERAPAMLEESFDHLFRAWSDPPRAEARGPHVIAPRLVYHVLAGNVPWAGVESLFAAVLSGSASLVKLSSREPVLTGLVARALAEEDARWADALAALHWPGGDHALEEAALGETDAVVAFGDNDAVADYARRLAHRIASGRVLFIPRGHRVSVALLGPGVLANEGAARAAARALALDVACEDQEGCLSPTAVYLVRGPSPGVTPERFAALLADEMRERERLWPRRPLTNAESAAVQQARSAAEFQGLGMWAAEGSTAWTVTLEDNAAFEPALAARFARVRVVDTMAQAIEALGHARGLISTVGVAGWKDVGELRSALASVAPGRVCPLGAMQRPPAGWSHEGASDLEALLRRMEWEGER
jgi:hypothetical protein